MEATPTIIDADNDVPVDPKTLKYNFDLYTTRRWYGHHHLEQDSYITDKYFQWVNRMVYKIKDQLTKILSKYCADNIVDLMWVLIIDDEYCNKDLDHQLYVLAIAFVLHVENKLLFSTLKRKYLYMDKVTQITRSVINTVKDDIAKNTLCAMGGVCVMGILAYKYLA
jgi:hypothetical protein